MLTIENKINILKARLNRLNARAMEKDNAGARRKIERQIRNLERELESN